MPKFVRAPCLVKTRMYLLALDDHQFFSKCARNATARAWAASATSARRFYPLWSFGFDGSIFRTDYRSDTDFVREIPAVFELTEKGVQQYLWTGNRAYVDDSRLFTYYRNSVNAFVTAHDDNRNGVADEDGTGKIFQGVASYN